MFSPVYFDHNATTPLRPEVRQAMQAWLESHYGNASSRHEYGRAARRALDEARQQVAQAVGAHPTEVIFTSGGSEANNLFIKGMAANQTAGLIAVSATEHPSVLYAARALRRQGWRVRELAVDHDGRLNEAELNALMAEQAALISIMHANNETGVLQDISTCAARASVSGASFHSDAVQALGKVALDFRTLNSAGLHALSLSAHKLGGPLGAGALIADKRLDLAPLIDGGGQERGLRSGSENIAAIVGFAAACTAAVAELDDYNAKLSALRDEIAQALTNLQVSRRAVIFAAEATRLPNTLYFSVPGLDGETLVGSLDRAGFAVANGSACSAAAPGTSHVLAAMGVDQATARGAVRISLGRDSTQQQVTAFIKALSLCIQQMQQMRSVIEIT